MKQFVVAVSVVLAAAGFAGPAVSADMTLSDLMAKMENADKSIESVSFGFSQEVAYTLTSEKQSSRGEVVFRKPGNLYVKQEGRTEQVIVTNGKKVWVYTPAYRQVVIENWKKWTGNSMLPSSLLNFGNNLADLRKKYAFNYLGTDDGKHLLLLAPLKKDVWQLKLWIDPGTYAPAKAVLSGENIVITTVTENYVLNPKVDAKLFEFVPPEGVDVVRP